MTTSSPNATMLPQELTIIVAATSKMGIGLNNTLPWKGLKREMAYFARVTKRASAGKTNAIIMGRKTWDSIPPKFRPLKDRTNIVVSRSTSTETEAGKHTVSSIKEGLEFAKQNGDEKVFVIGGAEIYKLALGMRETKRVLLTRVKGEFECDAFFPVKLGEGGGETNWKKMGKEELDGWTGEIVPEGKQEEGGTRYEFEMWERVGDA